MCRRISRNFFPLHPHFNGIRFRVVVQRCANDLQLGMLVVHCSLHIPVAIVFITAARLPVRARILVP